MISFRPKTAYDKDAVLVLLGSGQTHPRFKKDLEKGEVYPVIEKGRVFLFAGLGNTDKLSLTDLRIQVRKALLSGYLKKARSVEIVPHSKNDTAIISIIEGVAIGTYVWDKYKSRDKEDKTVKDKHITINAEPKKAFLDAVNICQGVSLTRDLVNDNADTITSDYLEKTVRGLIKGHKPARLEVLNRKELKARGLNLILAVNQASNKEPKLIIVRYDGAKKNEGYTAIIGKGMTFDTGGLNLKPTGSIETMKIDMAGAAAVCGLLRNALALKIKKNLLFVLGVAENSIGSAAYKPGDVLTGYAGKSVEIGNTDAEGRLVLADAFAYVVKNYKPSKMIDLATLTGACVVALGFDYSGLFSNSDELARELMEASRKTDDRAWHMPLYPEIKEYIKSPIADIKNTSNIKGAGACTAAEFLHQFTEGTTWAHLDIAGTSYADGHGRMYYGHGATGAGVRLLTHYLLHN
ncbi:MAG: leucyl aminopeptidase [Candidatus Omnitrophica bacterium]|nr:leucyl aminopeptidase [Candidatus Omnitrophota bacterium]MDE2009739.1 leucyl aminopeptidase [Candidatus Omnitrophota bacterium]MDE2213864.1 leucyl aminopeptidase [Candidatus Omnitrophota bacterium]MDE2231877.1 leucyl aminopeptidase [Candidatus Omnitrophota bacterium]